MIKHVLLYFLILVLYMYLTCPIEKVFDKTAYPNWLLYSLVDNTSMPHNENPSVQVKMWKFFSINNFIFKYPTMHKLYSWQVVVKLWNLNEKFPTYWNKVFWHYQQLREFLKNKLFPSILFICQYSGFIVLLLQYHTHVTSASVDGLMSLLLLMFPGCVMFQVNNDNVYT